jgi:polyisoprenoid-binding protein YceI
MSATIQQVPTGTWVVDPVHSSAEFAVKHMGIKTFRTGFDEVDARLQDGVLTGRVPVASIRIANADFKGHVLAEDFFDAATTPDLTFASRSIVLGEDGTAEVAGDLTIRGTTLPVTARGTIAGPQQHAFNGTRVLAVELTADIDRTAYGLRWNAELPGGGKALGERVQLIVDLELVEQA